MNQIQTLHQQAMDLAENAFTAKLRGDRTQADQLLRQAFAKEAEAAALVTNNLDAEPTRSVLHRSAASLAIECGEFQTAERLIATALTGNPPKEIAEELRALNTYAINDKGALAHEMMEPTQLASAAVQIARYIADGTVGGVLEEIGGGIVRFLMARLGGRFGKEQVQQNPRQVEEDILQALLNDSEFRRELEQLVAQYEQAQRNMQNNQQTGTTVNQNVKSGVAINTNNNQGNQFFRW